MIIIAKKGQASSKKIYNPKSREVQMQPSITKNPSAELKIKMSTKKVTKADRIKKHRKKCECCPGHYLSTSVY